MPTPDAYCSPYSTRSTHLKPLSACSSALLRAGIYLLLLFALSSLQACSWLDVSLRRAAFRPTPATTDDLKTLAADVEVYFVPVPRSALAGSELEERLSLFWFPSRSEQAPTVLYLHGVFRNVIQNAPKIEAIRASGFNVLAVDYRGWGLSSTLVPSEQSITADAALAFAELQRREPIAKRRLVFGHSLGGAVAVKLASTAAAGSFRQLVLESTFASTRSLTIASRWYGFLLAPFVGSSFDAKSLIGQLKVPISMMHGTADNTVPLSQGQELHAAAPAGTPFVIVEKGLHSNLHTADPERYRAYWRQLSGY